MRWHFFLTIVLASGVCCGSESECNAPSHTEYTCEPIAPGSVGCIGGPRYQAGGGSVQDDPDKTFPLQCGARIPYCSGFDRSSARSFQCVQSIETNDAGIDAPIVWLELL